MAEYVVFNKEHFVTVEGVRFYEDGDRLEGDELTEAVLALGSKVLAP